MDGFTSFLQAAAVYSSQSQPMMFNLITYFCHYLYILLLFIYLKPFKFFKKKKQFIGAVLFENSIHSLLSYAFIRFIPCSHVSDPYLAMAVVQLSSLGLTSASCSWIIRFSVLPSQLSCASQGTEGKSCMKGGGRRFSVLRNDAQYFNILASWHSL